MTDNEVELLLAMASAIQSVAPNHWDNLQDAKSRVLRERKKKPGCPVCDADVPEGCVFCNRCAADVRS